MKQCRKPASSGCARLGRSISLVGYRVIMSLRRIVCQVLDKFPVVTIAIEEVDALPIGVVVHRRGVFIARRFEALMQPLDVIHLVSEVVHARHASIGLPTFLRLNGGLTQGDVSLGGSDMNPSRPLRMSGIEPYSE